MSEKCFLEIIFFAKLVYVLTKDLQGKIKRSSIQMYYTTSFSFNNTTLKKSSKTHGFSYEVSLKNLEKYFIPTTPGPRLMQIHLVQNSTSAKFEKSTKIFT